MRSIWLSLVSGVITASASASDNVGVVGVQFKLDGANLEAEDSSAPYSLSWNTTAATNGPHTLTAVARDGPGNTKTSTGISITVNNADTTAGPPPPPGVSEPLCLNNPNVVFCDDFETGDYSRWPSGNPAFSPSNPGPSTDRPFTGQYSLKYAYGELSGPSYLWNSFPAGTTELWIRFYVYMDALFHWGFNSGVDHTFSMWARGGTTCSNIATGFDWGPMFGYVYRPGTESCMNRWDAPLNMGSIADRTLHNGKWYRIDYHLKLNGVDGCTDKNGNGSFDAQGECDGVYEVWYDGKQVMGYYDVNMRSNDAGTSLKDFLFNHYYRTGGQTFNGKGFNEYRDNLVIISGPNNGRPIGPVANEPPVGTPDLMSPYKTEVYKDWVAFDSAGRRLRPGADCAASILMRGISGNWWDNSGEASYVSTPAHNAVQTHCAFRASGGDKSIAARTFNANQFAGDGIGMPRGFPNKTYVLNHWIYLDPAAFPAANGASLSSIFSYGTGAARNYMAIGVDSQNHPILIRQFHAGSAVPVVLATNPDATIAPGVWHQVELRGREDHTWSILLNGLEVIRQTNVDDGAFWAKTDLAYHFGISDHRNNTQTLQIFIDEMSAGSTSFQDCFGWNPTICPFGTPPPDSTLPSVSITAPLNGATVSGSAVTVSASASENVGVIGIQFKLNGANLGAEVTTAPYAIPWNTTATTSGVHSLTAVARDAAGNVTASSVVSVTASPAPSPSTLQLHHAGQDFGRLTEPALRIGGADWQSASTHKDRTLPDRLTTTATAQTRESGEIDLPIALMKLDQ